MVKFALYLIVLCVLSNLNCVTALRATKSICIYPTSRVSKGVLYSKTNDVLKKTSRLSLFSLDTTMLPAKKTFLPHLTSSIIVLFSVFLAIKNKLVPILEVSQNPIIGGIYDVSKNVFPGLILFSKVLSAKLSLLLEKGVRKLLRLTEDDDPEVVGQDDWSICTLGEREAISNRHVKYRFELDNPAAIVPLEVGQEVSDK